MVGVDTARWASVGWRRPSGSRGARTSGCRPAESGAPQAEQPERDGGQPWQRDRCQPCRLDRELSDRGVRRKRRRRQRRRRRGGTRVSAVGAQPAVLGPGLSRSRRARLAWAQRRSTGGARSFPRASRVEQRAAALHGPAPPRGVVTCVARAQHRAFDGALWCAMKNPGAVLSGVSAVRSVWVSSTCTGHGRKMA